MKLHAQSCFAREPEAIEQTSLCDKLWIDYSRGFVDERELQLLNHIQIWFHKDKWAIKKKTKDYQMNDMKMELGRWGMVMVRCKKNNDNIPNNSLWIERLHKASLKPWKTIQYSKHIGVWYSANGDDNIEANDEELV